MSRAVQQVHAVSVFVLLMWPVVLGTAAWVRLLGSAACSRPIHTQERDKDTSCGLVCLQAVSSIHNPFNHHLTMTSSRQLPPCHCSSYMQALVHPDPTPTAATCGCSQPCMQAAAALQLTGSCPCTTMLEAWAMQHHWAAAAGAWWFSPCMAPTAAQVQGRSHHL